MAIDLGDGRGRPGGPDSEVFDGTRQAVHAEEGVIGCITMTAHQGNAVSDNKTSTDQKFNKRQGLNTMTPENRRGTVSLRQISGSARSKKVRVDLGEESSFTAFPAPVKVGDASYFLVHGRDGYKLLSTVCPHQGGEVMDEGDDLFTCDGHGWQYEKGEGTCVTRPDFRMKAFLVTLREDHLFALVPDE